LPNCLALSLRAILMLHAVLNSAPMWKSETKGSTSFGGSLGPLGPLVSPQTCLMILQPVRAMTGD